LTSKTNATVCTETAGVRRSKRKTLGVTPDIKPLTAFIDTASDTFAAFISFQSLADSDASGIGAGPNRSRCLGSDRQSSERQESYQSD
jgi:hypothetical protein